MAQDAELKLKVSLDLGFFRQQLSTVGAQLGGQSLQLNIQFNKDSIKEQYKLLSRDLEAKTFKIKVESNTLDTLVEKVSTFKKNLEKLGGEIVKLGVNVESNVTKTKAAEVRRNIISDIAGPNGAVFIPIEVKPPLVKNINAIRKDIKDRLSGISIDVNVNTNIPKGASQGSRPASLPGTQGRQAIDEIEKVLAQGASGALFGGAIERAQQNIAKQAILKRLEKQSLGAGGYNKPGLEKIIRDLGGTPSGKREDLVAQAKKLVQESDGIADAVFDHLKDLQMKLRPIRGQAQASAARSMPNLNQMLDRIANLTENPRAAQRMLRMMPESRLTTDLVGAANKQAAIKEAGPGKFLDLRGKAFDPLLKVIAESFTDYTRSVNASNPWVGKIGSGMTELIGRALTQSPEQMFGGRTPALSNKLLPSIGGTTSPINTLERRLAQSRGALGTGGGVAGSLFTGRGLANPGVSMLEPVGLSGNYRGMAAALANQAANPALAHRQIADIGFGGVPTAATGMSGQALNRALNQAFLQRRGLGIGGGQSLPIFNAPGVAVQQNIPGMAHQMGGGGLGGSMGMFPTAGMMGPSSPLGRITAQSSMFAGGGGAMPPGGGGGFGGMGGLGGFGRAMGGINLPGAGAIRELGDEFGFATKQVLLFGQAYKLLGFLQSFPGQVGAAVGQLQTFRNTLGAISPNAQEAAASNQLILDLVEKYNVPLQSARDGFTKLYASMAPAGFSGDEIRNLFTGITQAAATFGMSADKVDRVNYAFAQMASKGQVMSEELKGQLGDVLPGAMSIFAKAAGFEGPKAIQDFSAALEAGSYKGEAMVALLKNVGVVMKQEFGPGAEGAALTFQGVINRMQNSMTLLYESLEPVAVGFLNTVVVPLTDGIKTISDGFTAFFTGAAAQTSGGFGIARELEQLKPAFEGIGNNVRALIEQLGQFARVGLEVGKVLLQIAGNPFIGYLARVYLSVLTLTTVIQILNLRALVPMIANLARSAYALIAFAAQCVRAGQAVQITGLMLRTFFASTGVGLVLVGIGMLIEKFMSMNQALADTRAKALGAADAIRSMSQTEARVAEQSAQSAYKIIGAIAGRAGTKVQGPGNDRIIEISERELKQLQGVGAFQTAKDPFTGRITARRSDILSLAPQAQRLQAQAAGQIRDLRFQEQQTQQQAALAPIPPGSGTDKGAGTAAQSLESLESLRDQLAKARMEGDMERAKILFEYQKRLDERRFEMQESGANDVQKAGIKLAKELFEIKMRFERAVFEAGAAVTREAGSVAPGNRPPRAPKGQGPYGAITQFGAGANANLQIGQQVGGADMQRPVSGSERRDIVAAEKTQQTVTTESIRLTYELKNAAEDYAQVIRQNFDAIFPVAQLQLQNQLLAARYQLELQGVPKEAIDAQLAITEAKAKGAAIQEELDKKLKESTQTIDKYTKLQEDGVVLTKQQAYELKEAEAFVGAYAAEVGRAAEQIKAFTEAQLENAIATMKQADALKAMEEVSGRINDAVEGVTSTYKSLFKEIAMGKDSVEALKQAQEALADQALTMFLDFAMKPVEDFFKNTLGGIFGIPSEEQKRKEAIDKMQAQLDELKAQKKIQEGIKDDTAAIRNGTGGQGSAQSQSIGGLAEGFLAQAGSGLSPFLSMPGGMGAAGGLSYEGVTPATGTGMGSIGSYDWAAASENMDASLSSVVDSINKNAEEAGPNGGTGMKFSEALGKTVQGIGIAAGAIMGIAAGINQIKEGGTSNVLGGIGSILLGVGGAIGGFAGMIPKSGKAANGAVWKGGFTAFANGGVVSGPTLGLIGEGKYNEAIVPLPDGKSIPVQLGGASSRELLSGGSRQQQSMPMLSMSFQTTKFGDREYVDIDQLQAAMAETRKMAARDGANRGASLALDKLQNSPSARRKVGMR